MNKVKEALAATTPVERAHVVFVVKGLQLLSPMDDLRESRNVLPDAATFPFM